MGENQNLPMMMKKEVRHQQLRRKKKKRKRKRRRKKRNKFLYTLPHPTNEVENLDFLQGFQVYFFLTHISLFNQSKYEKRGNMYNFKTQKIHQQEFIIE